jgi:biotin carboxyl carrier protein
MADKKVLYKVKVNDFEFSFSKEEVEAFDMIQTSPVDCNLLKDAKSVNARLLESDRTGKNLKIEVGGESFEVAIKEELDVMLDAMGFNKKSGKHIKEIKAPMPGLVLEISVSEGQQVAEGDKLLILVAMKMENSIKIAADATIKRIAVKPGQAVDKGQLLVELE